jgi:hypothetical protein
MDERAGRSWDEVTDYDDPPASGSNDAESKLDWS